MHSGAPAAAHISIQGIYRDPRPAILRHPASGMIERKDRGLGERCSRNPKPSQSRSVCYWPPVTALEVPTELVMVT
jgi:hypothetical protein